MNPAATRNGEPTRVNPVFEALMGSLVVAFALVVFAWELADILPADPGKVAADLAAKFVRPVPDLRPEPTERMIFLVLTLLTPIAAWTWHTRVRLAVQPLVSETSRTFWTYGFIALVALSAVGFSRSGIVILMIAPLSKSWGWIAITLVLGVLTAAWMLKRLTVSSRENATARRVTFAIACLASAYFILTWKWYGLGRVSDAGEFSFHLGPAFYPVTQAVAGKIPLRDYVSLYGYYGEFLAPWFRLIGFSVGTFTATMSVLQVAAMCSIFYFLYRTLGNTILLAAIGPSLIVFCQVWTVLQDQGDCYFQHWPVRFLFPAFSLPLFLAWRRKPSNFLWNALALFSGVALLWNLDTGVVVAGAFIATSLVEEIATDRRTLDNLVAFAKKLATFVGVMVGVVFLFLVTIRVRSGVWVDPLELFRFQSTFFGAGYFMLPMPVKPHPWHLVGGLYVVGFVIGVGGIRRFASSSGPHGDNPIARKVDPLFFLSVLGWGLFVYYQGRSHDYVFTAVMWPATIVFFLLVLLFIDAAAKGVVSKRAAFVATLPALQIGFICAALLAIKAPALWSQASRVHSLRGTPIQSDVEYLSSALAPGNECAILSHLQSVYFAETGLISALRGAGLGDGQLILREDMNHVNDQLKRSVPKHLFIQSNYLPGQPGNPLDEGLHNLQARYDLKSVSPTRRLFHFIRREP